MTDHNFNISPSGRLVALVLTGAVLLAGQAAWGQIDIIDEDSGLHIPPGRTVAAIHNMTDGNGYIWPINMNGAVQQGTNYSYVGGMRILVDGGTPFMASAAWADADGDEIEIGPGQSGRLKIFRRVRVYRDQPLARWLDIFVNATGHEIRVGVEYQSGIPHGINNVRTSSGDDQWGDDDSWFITAVRQPTVPSLLHFVCDNASPVRPDVAIHPAQITMRYNLTVPAGDTVILCHFESQNNQTAHNQSIQAFDLRRLLSDLSGAVRGRIVNFRARTGIGDVYLNRTAEADTVVLNSGDVIYGTITNEQFVIEAFFETLTIPAEGIVGMEAGQGDQATTRTVLADGQILCGDIVEGQLNVTLSTGGQLVIPIDKIAQWSYRISDERPELSGIDGPVVLLQTGDLLGFELADADLTFRTPHGVVPLSASDVRQVRLATGSDSGHQALLMNNSRISGLLASRELTLSLTLGPTVTVRREMVKALRFAERPQPDASLTRLTLTNGDVLIGALTDQQIHFDSDFGGGELTATDIRSVELSATHPGRARILLWDNTVLRGELTSTEIGFQVIPGPTLNISTAQIVSIVRAQVTPPTRLGELVEQLVVRLGAESYTDRESASEELKGMAPTIIPILRRYLQSDDPEIRRRLQEIIEHLDSQAPASGQIEFPIHNQPVLDVRS